LPVTNFMRPLCLLFLSAAAAFSQPFSFGVKGGLPMTDFLSSVRSQSFTSTTTTNRYIIGPTAELRLPFGLGVEVDVLYRHFSFGSSGGISGITSTFTTSDTSGGAWEFPILGKYRFTGKVLRPFVDAGVSWDKLSGLSQTITRVVSNVASTSTTSDPFELHKDTTRGFVLGAGLDVKLLLLHISPEVRFTRWGAKHFIDPNGLLDSKQNQAEFLVGITF
jgi:opacity protein-like surface antigen